MGYKRMKKRKMLFDKKPKFVDWLRDFGRERREQLDKIFIDMWEDIINILAEYVPGEKSVFEILQSKYKVKQND